ncbi:hypothetical protein C8Q77DRAFT_799559 [Trametes polyzona]|nr:hypothetical protein C8Q77DRAFT_799559 [Trametes polyzona]
MHRDMSIPAWTVLRAPSASSEDELQSRASPEMVDEIAPSPPPVQRRVFERRQHAPGGPSSQRQANGSRAGMGVSRGTQSAMAAPRMPPPPTTNRRPLSGSDEDDESRPRKKKKQRQLVNPYAAGASVRLPDLPPARRGMQSKVPSSVASNASQDDHRNRRVNTSGSAADGHGFRSALGRMADGQTPRRASDIGLPSSSRPPPSQLSSQMPPLSQARSRRAMLNIVEPPNGSPRSNPSATAGPSTQHTAHPPPAHEVIEILESESDDEPQPPPRPAAPPPDATQCTAAAPVPVPPSVPPIPRRKQYKATAPPPPAPQYRVDENGVIDLLSDSDEPPPPRPQTAASSSTGGRGPHPEPPSAPPELSSEVRSGEAEPPPPLDDGNSQDAPTATGPPNDTRAPMPRPLQPPETAIPEQSERDDAMVPEGAEDVDMAEGHCVPEEPPPDEVQPMDDVANLPEPELEEPPDPDLIQEDEAVPDPVGTAAGLEATPASDSSEQALVEMPLSSAETPGNHLNLVSEAVAPPLPQDLASLSAQTGTAEDAAVGLPTPEDIAGETPVDLPLVHPLPTDIRSETASPVSAVLDPQLKDLAITSTSNSNQSSERASPVAIRPPPAAVHSPGMTMNSI